MNDLLGIPVPGDDFSRGRITLNDGGFMDSWLGRGQYEEEHGPDFSFYWKAGKRTILRENELVVVAIKMPRTSDEWLLATVCRVTKIDPKEPRCERAVLKEYRKWFNRVVFRYRRKQGALGYNYTLRHVLPECEVLKILEKPYDSVPFPGFMNLNEKMRNLKNLIENKHSGSEWKEKLRSVKAIYCLNNHAEGKVYIGSAYGNGGCLLSRWEDYFENFHGGNVGLKALFQKKGEDYFLDNFYFSILEILPQTATEEEVLPREKHWKKVFNSSEKGGFGYNHN